MLASASPHMQPSLAKRLQQQLRFGDYLIALLFLALAIGSTRWQHVRTRGTPAEFAQVLVRNQIVGEWNVHQADTITVQGSLGAVRIAIGDDAIRVLASSCPQQICVQQGKVQYAGQMLVCAPNHLAVVLMSNATKGLDAITY